MAAEEARGGQNAPLWGPPGTSENIMYILRIGKALLLGFIRTLWKKYTASHPKTNSLEQIGGEDMSVEPSDMKDMPDSAQIISLQECMLRIWQELSKNPEFTCMAESVIDQNPLAVLAEVSEHTFATGINWGRIVVFFYFAYKVIAQSNSNWFNSVVNWTMGFLRDRLASWIQQQGGWIAMLCYSPPSA